MNIMDAKKEFKFKTHTCKIDVLGIEKEITYDNVIWISPNKLWILYANDDGIIQVEKFNDVYCDYPLMYDNGHVVYDGYLNIPKYVKENIKRILNKHF